MKLCILILFNTYFYRKQKKVEELKVTFSETIEETEDDEEAPEQMMMDEMFQQEADPKYVCL